MRACFLHFASNSPALLKGRAACMVDNLLPLCHLCILLVFLLSSQIHSANTEPREGTIKDGHGVLCRGYVVVPVKVLTGDPCPLWFTNNVDSIPNRGWLGAVALRQTSCKLLCKPDQRKKLLCCRRLGRHFGLKNRTESSNPLGQLKREHLRTGDAARQMQLCRSLATFQSCRGRDLPVLLS